MIHFPNISVLLSHEANVNAEDYRGYTPLFYAADNHCFGNLIELLDTGRVEVNHEAKNANTALSKARSYETLMILRKHGAKITRNQLDSLIKCHNTSSPGAILNQSISEINDELLILDFENFSTAEENEMNLHLMVQEHDKSELLLHPILQVCLFFLLTDVTVLSRRALRGSQYAITRDLVVIGDI